MMPTQENRIISLIIPPIIHQIIKMFADCFCRFAPCHKVFQKKFVLIRSAKLRQLFKQSIRLDNSLHKLLLFFCLARLRSGRIQLEISLLLAGIETNDIPSWQRSAAHRSQPLAGRKPPAINPGLHLLRQ